ncbi:MAG TPA: hypothetical protein VER96_11420 [Polyangiaceae bacterium]|nr:hypothetical protein [Polyangiaceae bacterium]
MSRIACQRTWQVEAARDGRLVGSDLSNALRHRSECADCKQAARALDELGLRLKALPKPAVDALTQRRTRQALLTAFNTQLLAEPVPRAKPRLPLIAALCAISGVALAIGYPRAKQTTRSTAPAFSALTVAPCANGAALPEPSSPNPPAAQASGTARELAQQAPAKAQSKSGVSRSKTIAVSDTAEDDAYLQIVVLLRSGREREARAKAAQYLVRFPSGFRRPEVEKIAH